MIAASAGETAFDALAVACLRAEGRIDALSLQGDGDPVVEAHLHGDIRSVLVETARLTLLGVDVRPSKGQRSEASRMSALIGRRFGPVALKLRLDVPPERPGIEPEGPTASQLLDVRLDAEALRSWQAAAELVEASSVKGTELARLLRAVPPPERVDQAERLLSRFGSDEKGTVTAPE
jgi:hypothetical protein